MEKPDVVNEAMKVFEGLIKELEGSFFMNGNFLN